MLLQHHVQKKESEPKKSHHYVVLRNHILDTNVTGLLQFQCYYVTISTMAPVSNTHPGLFLRYEFTSHFMGKQRKELLFNPLAMGQALLKETIASTFKIEAYIFCTSSWNIWKILNANQSSKKILYLWSFRLLICVREHP